MPEVVHEVLTFATLAGAVALLVRHFFGRRPPACAGCSNAEPIPARAVKPRSLRVVDR